MTVNFQPDACMPKDPAGWGRYLTGHYYEHIVLAQKCAALAKPVIVPNFDVLSWKDEPQFVQQWLVNHEAMHVQIRAATNVTGIDLSLVDFSQDQEFLGWQDDHSQEHLTFRQILGIV
jgi:hypothetical protein